MATGSINFSFTMKTMKCVEEDRARCNRLHKTLRFVSVGPVPAMSSGFMDFMLFMVISFLEIA